MFFPDKITKITRNSKVLEVGPGGSPHPLASVFLEKSFEDKDEAHAQRGYAKEVRIGQKTFYYDGGIFPFDDKEFDYVICSHVLEHVPVGELPLFISELQRVS